MRPKPQKLPVSRGAMRGRIEVITGPMFSGKSEELIRRLRRARIARQRVACFKPELDQRYDMTAIASHSAKRYAAIAVCGVEALRKELKALWDRVDVIGIDEAQFFEEAIVPLVLELVQRGKRVLVAGLDMTYAGQPFGAMPALMAVADEVLKLPAVCMVCGQPAVHTQRLGKSRAVVVVGAAEMYEARCRVHFEPAAETAVERPDTRR